MKILSVAETPPEENSVVIKSSSHSTNDSSSSSCFCLRIFQSYFHKAFYKLGFIIGQKPSYFIIIPVFVTLLGLTGIQRVKFDDDPNYLFDPTDGLTTTARTTIEELFPVNSSYKFDPSRITRNRNFAKLLITSKDNETLFRNEVWEDVKLLDELIQNITIDWEGELFNYSILCSKWEGACFPNLIYNLNEIMPEVANRSLWISYPVMLFPLVLPLFFGGVEVNETEGILISTKGVFTTYFLAEDDWKQKSRAHLWEGELLNLLDSTEFETINVAKYASRSLKDELLKNSACLVGFLPIAIVLLLIFTIGSVSMFDWVRSKVQMSVLGLFTVVMASCSSFGYLMYLGIPFVTINAAAPFLILGIGLDDMFILLSSWRKTRLQDPIANRLAETYSEAAVSVTVTSLTNLASFFVGTLTTFPAVHIFCLYLGTAVLFTYVWFLTFFGGCLAIVGYMEKGQKHALSCKTIKAKSELGNSSYCHRLWCGGGINKSDPWNVKDNQQSSVAKWLRDKYAKALDLPLIRGFVIILFVVYLSGALFGCVNLQQGLERKNLNLDGSYLTTFYEVEDALFRKFPYRIQVVIKGNLTFSDENTKNKLLELHDALEDIPYVGPRLYTRSWIRGFYSYLRRRPHLKENITDEVSFIRSLQTEFLSPRMRESLDILYNEDETQILAARFIIQGYEVQSMEEDKKMIKALKEVADNFEPFEVFVYHPSFVYYDQFILVGPTMIKSVILAAFIMIVISVIFVPNPLSALWIGLSVVSINIGVIGYMALWSVRLDTISIINLIMCIGFSVDYSAHISYSYLNCKSNSTSSKMRQCLYNVGVPVMQSGFSTIIVIVVFIFTPSYIYRTFFKIIVLVALFGMFHALVILPVMLSFFDKGLCSSASSEDEATRNATIPSLNGNIKFNSGDKNVKRSNGVVRKDSDFDTSGSSSENSLSSTNSNKTSQSGLSNSKERDSYDNDIEIERL